MKAQYIKIDKYGNKYYYSDKAMTVYNREEEDGPAVEFSNGKQAWFKQGVLHREHGPALKYKNGDCFWFINGKEVTRREHHDFFNPPKAKTFNINGKDFTVEQLNDLIKTAKGNLL